MLANKISIYLSTNNLSTVSASNTCTKCYCSVSSKSKPTKITEVQEKYTVEYDAKVLKAVSNLTPFF